MGISNPSESNIDKSISAIFDDNVFLKLLQWKQQQLLLFCMLNEFKTVLTWNLSSCNTNVAPFWCYFSNSLRSISDPKTYKTSNYNPLYLDFSYYLSSSFKSKYNTTAKEIICALETMENMNINTIKEILYQSNGSLTFITKYSEIEALLSDHAMLKNDANSPKVQSYLNEVFDIYSDCSKVSTLKKPIKNKKLQTTDSPITPHDICILDDIMDKMDKMTFDSGNDETESKEQSKTHTYNGGHHQKDSLCAEEDGWWFTESYADYDKDKDIDYTIHGNDYTEILDD